MPPPHVFWDQCWARFSRRGVDVSEKFWAASDLYGKSVRQAQAHTNHKRSTTDLENLVQVANAFSKACKSPGRGGWPGRRG